MDKTDPGPGGGTGRDVRYERSVVEAALDEVGARLHAGDPGALEECYRLLGPLVSSYLARFVPQPDIEDVLQRVFYEVWRVHERYDPDLSLRGWVLGIARKRAIDQLRKRRDVVVPIESMRDIVGDDGRETAERMVWADEVRSALDALPEPQLQVLQLAYFEGYTQRRSPPHSTSRSVRSRPGHPEVCTVWPPFSRTPATPHERHDDRAHDR